LTINVEVHVLLIITNLHQLNNARNVMILVFNVRLRRSLSAIMKSTMMSAIKRDVDSVVRGASASQTVAVAGAGASISSSTNGRTAFNVVILTKFLIYIRYMKIRFSPELFLFLKNYDESTI